MIVLDEEPDGLSVVEDHGVAVGLVWQARVGTRPTGKYLACCANGSRTQVPGAYPDKQAAADALEAYLERHPRMRRRLGL